jgi:hypothetical protein
MCRLNSTSANYKASTRAQIQLKTVQIHNNKALNRQNKTNIAVSNIKVLGQNPYKVERNR